MEAALQEYTIDRKNVELLRSQFISSRLGSRPSERSGRVRRCC